MTTTGYVGLFLLMVAESMILPIPSEAVMPFAGYLAAQGEMTVLGAMLASSAGSVVGSLIGYGMGAYGLLPLLRKYGKYVLVQAHHINAAHAWFERRGLVAVFICRFIPGVRHVSSIPAGGARMSIGPFILATLMGATLWNGFLFWLGYAYGTQVAEATKPYLDLVGILLLLLLALYIGFEIWRSKRARSD
jgi:membrane protein DedA with SNARE-associated domain